MTSLRTKMWRFRHFLINTILLTSKMMNKTSVEFHNNGFYYERHARYSYILCFLPSISLVTTIRFLTLLRRRKKMFIRLERSGSNAPSLLTSWPDAGSISSSPTYRHLSPNVIEPMLGPVSRTLEMSFECRSSIMSPLLTWDWILLVNSLRCSALWRDSGYIAEWISAEITSVRIVNPRFSRHSVDSKGSILLS